MKKRGEVVGVGEWEDGGKGGENLLEEYRKLVAMQSSVIHALVAALGAVGEEEEEEGDEDGGESGGASGGGGTQWGGELEQLSVCDVAVWTWVCMSAVSAEYGWGVGDGRGEGVVWGVDGGEGRRVRWRRYR